MYWRGGRPVHCPRHRRRGQYHTPRRPTPRYVGLFGCVGRGVVEVAPAANDGGYGYCSPVVHEGPLSTTAPPQNVIKARKKRGPKPPQRSGGGRPLFARALVYHQSETVGFKCFLCVISSLFGRFPLLLTTGDIAISGAVVNSGGNNLRVNHLWHAF